jgi:hypothetical protein
VLEGGKIAKTFRIRSNALGNRLCLLQLGFAEDMMTLGQNKGEPV